MARVVKEFGVAILVKVEPAAQVNDWGPWRTEYEGNIGWLNLCESEHKDPGEQFLYFFGGDESEKDWWLKTYYGQIEQDENRIVFKTTNSIYTFERRGTP